MEVKNKCGEIKAENREVHGGIFRLGFKMQLATSNPDGFLVTSCPGKCPEKKDGINVVSRARGLGQEGKHKNKTKAGNESQ